MIAAFLQLWAIGFLATWIFATASRWNQGTFGAAPWSEIHKIFVTDALACAFLWPAVLVILLTQDNGRSA